MHTSLMTADCRRLLVVAFGAVCWAVASSVNKWLVVRSGDGGWFDYAPNNGVAYSLSSGWILRELAIWLIAIVVWVVIGLRVLRRSDED